MALETLTQSDANTYDVLIVGGGPAGLTAASYAARANLKTAFIEKDVPGGKIVNIQKITNYPGCINIAGADLALNMYNQAIDAKAEYIYGNVTNITQRKNFHVIFLENGAHYFAKTCIIATGTIETKLNVPGEEEYKNKGLSYCAICDGSLTKDKIVVVFGEHEQAVEDTLYLSNIAKKVYLVNKTNQLEPVLLTKVNNNPKIEIINNSECKEIKGDGNQVTSVLISNNKEIITDFVFIFIGSTPSTQFIPKTPNIVNHETQIINVDPLTKSTSIKGLYAAGDNTRNLFRQITTAVSDGTIAVLSAIKYLKEEWKKNDI